MIKDTQYFFVSILYGNTFFYTLYQALAYQGGLTEVKPHPNLINLTSNFKFERVI